MSIKSVLLATALFQNVIPSGFRNNVQIEPLAIFQHEIQYCNPGAMPIIPITNPYAITNFAEEIITPQLGFGPEMPFIDALSMATSMNYDTIGHVMDPFIAKQKGTGSLNDKALHKVFNRKHVNLAEATTFLSSFQTVFPKYHVDIFEAKTDLYGNQMLSKYPYGKNPYPGVTNTYIKLFAQCNGLYRAMIPNPQKLNAANLQLHQSVQHPIANNAIDAWRNDVNAQLFPQQQTNNHAIHQPAKQAVSGVHVTIPMKSGENGESGKSGPSGKVINIAKDPKQNDKTGKSTKDPKDDKDGKSGKGKKDTNKAKGAKNDKDGKHGAKGAKKNDRSDKRTKDSKTDKDGQDKKKDNKWIIIVCIAAAVVIIPAVAFGIYAVMSGKRQQPSQASGSGNSAANQV